jgi:hypothetical protein
MIGGRRNKGNRGLQARGTAYKASIYFLYLSLLLLTNGVPGIVAGTKEKSLPIGEMVSRGEVRFEMKENVWKSVEPMHFPVFKGVKIKTEEGVSVIALANRSRIEVGQRSMISFKQDDQLSLFQGGFNFRIPPSAEVSFKIGSLTIMKSRHLQAAKDGNVASAKSEETIGSMSMHSNGSLTVKTVQGELSILDQEYIVLASLPQKETLTIPSAIVSGKQRVMIAQAGDPEELREEMSVPPDGGLRFGVAGAWTSIFLNAAMITAISAASMEDPICK